MAQAWQTPEEGDSNRSLRAGKSDKGKSAEKLPAGLYVVATPIGHARDITLRALDVLRGVDLIAAEDTRVTAKLLAIYAIRKPVVAYNDHNAPDARPYLLKKLQAGLRIAQVSDAGMPLVSDPGFKLVREALAEGIPVESVPGVSAPLTALTLSGLPSDRFFFAGFLPAKAGERLGALKELNPVRATLIFFESPQRLGETLAAMAEIFGPRAAAVGRELTKLHQEVRRAPLDALARDYAEAPPKGEITVVVAPPAEAVADYGKVEKALRTALPFMPVKTAVTLVAEMLTAPRREVYARALKLKKDAQD
jgi:16S rRNA (cytidine1402-2'-O)-methyltransferase